MDDGVKCTEHGSQSQERKADAHTDASTMTRHRDDNTTLAHDALHQHTTAHRPPRIAEPVCAIVRRSTDGGFKQTAAAERARLRAGRRGDGGGRGPVLQRLRKRTRSIGGTAMRWCGRLDTGEGVARLHGTQHTPPARRCAAAGGEKTGRTEDGVRRRAEGSEGVRGGRRAGAAAGSCRRRCFGCFSDRIWDQRTER